MTTVQRDAAPGPQASAGRLPALTHAPARTLRRCGGVSCPPGTCNHEDEPALRRRVDPGASGPQQHLAPPIVHEVLRSSGQPLDVATRAHYEPRFGHSFGDVRVHADSRAAESARAVQAHAYTVGRDVVLGATARSRGGVGTRTLAHELAHVVQQAGGSPGQTGAALRVGDPDSAAEREADAAAGAIHEHGTRSSVSPQLQRQATTQAPPPAPPTPPGPVAAGASLVDCTTQNAAEIRAAVPVARAMVAKAVRLVGAPVAPVPTLLRKYFNDDGPITRLRVLMGYGNIRNGISGSFTIECEQPGSFMYNYFCGGTYAYVRSVPWANVHLCGGAFGRGVNDLAETIVHEASHRFDDTDDEEYCWSGCSSSLSRTDAYDNADSFSKFALEAFTAVP